MPIPMTSTQTTANIALRGNREVIETLLLRAAGVRPGYLSMEELDHTGAVRTRAIDTGSTTRPAQPSTAAPLACGGGGFGPTQVKRLPARLSGRTSSR